MIGSRAQWTFAVMSVAWFAFALDRLVVSTALPVIRTDLESGRGALTWADLEWTVNAYTLAFAVLLLTGAALGDRFGRRRMFIIGIAVFTFSSAGAGSPDNRCADRGPSRPRSRRGDVHPADLDHAVGRDAAAPARSVLGALGAVGGLGAALGPLVGELSPAGRAGVWIFWLNVPLGLALVPIALRRLDESYSRTVRLDLTGADLSSAGLAGVVWAAIRTESSGRGGLDVQVALAGGLLALAAFVGWERRTATPMLPLRFLRNRTSAWPGWRARHVRRTLRRALLDVSAVPGGPGVRAARGCRPHPPRWP